MLSKKTKVKTQFEITVHTASNLQPDTLYTLHWRRGSKSSNHGNLPRVCFVNTPRNFGATLVHAHGNQKCFTRINLRDDK